MTCLDMDETQHQFLLSGSSDSSVKVWKVGSSQATVLGDLNKNTGGHGFGITGVQWWPHDTGMFLTSSYDESLKVWDSNTLEEAFSFDLGVRVNHFDVSKLSNLISAGCDSTHVRILDLRSTSAVQSLSGHQGTILSCKWNPMDANMLATGSSHGEVRLWDIRKTNACISQLDLYRTDKTKAVMENKSSKIGVMKSNAKAHSSNCNGLTWMENGRTLITTGGDDKIRVWDLDVPGGVNTLLNFGQFVKNKSQAYKSMVLSPLDETEVQYLWCPSDNGELLVFRAMDGKLVNRLRKNIQDAARSTCVVYAGRSTATYFSGTTDGRIFTWGPKQEENSDSENDG